MILWTATGRGGHCYCRYLYVGLELATARPDIFASGLIRLFQPVLPDRFDISEVYRERRAGRRGGEEKDNMVNESIL